MRAGLTVSDIMLNLLAVIGPTIRFCLSHDDPMSNTTRPKLSAVRVTITAVVDARLI